MLEETYRKLTMHYSQGDLAILSAETYNPGGKPPAAIPQSKQERSTRRTQRSGNPPGRKTANEQEEDRREPEAA